MKLFELKGGTKEARELAEKFLHKHQFEKRIYEIIFESIVLGIPYEETQKYKVFKKYLISAVRQRGK